nr:hypothetical protein [Tianweitania sediminis]
MLSETVNCRRPFATTREMDEFLISAWNAVVRPDDLVFHLGDFSFGLGDEQRVRSIFYRLHGRKRLIIGNHDVRKGGDLHPTLAGLDWDAPPAHAAETTDEGQRVYLSHYAHRVWPAAHKGAAHFYGHSHGSLEGLGRSRDVGVDCADTGFAPRTFRQLTGEWKGNGF